MPHNNLTLLTLDFETYYDTKFSLGKMTTMEYVASDQFKIWGVGIKFEDNPTEWFSAEELDVLNDIDWEQTVLLCQNTLFDGYILYQKFGIRPAYYLDTAAMARGLNPSESARLKDIAVRYFPEDETMRKGEELVNAKGIYDLPPEIEEQIAGYCIQDVELTYAIYNKMEFPESELDIINLTTEMFCVPRLMLDRDRVHEFLATEKANTAAKLQASGLTRELLASNQKFAAWIEEQGLPVPTKKSPSTGKDIPAFSKNDVQWKAFTLKHPEYKHIFDAREVVKSRIAETRAERFLSAAHDDGSFSVPLRYYAAHTGRFGGTDKINLQNLPRKSILRRALLAPKDCYVYVADLSNIESRMLAWFAGQDDLLEQYATGEDIYCNFASGIYNKPINKNDHPTERFVGKTAILGLGYSMGAQKFKGTLASGAAGPTVNISFDEAQSVVHNYRSTYPEIDMLWTRCNHFLHEMHNAKFRQGSVTNFYDTYKCVGIHPDSISLPNGLHLRYPNLTPLQEGGFRFQGKKSYEYTYGGKLTENIIQALSRIVITDAMIRISKIEDLDIVLTVHDEIICIGPKSDADSRFSAIIDAMCVPPVWASNLPLAAEGGYDFSYSK